MKISYSKKYLRFNLFLGIMWLTMACISFLLDEPIRWSHYFWFIIAALYLGFYWFQKKYKYLSIENGTITENGPMGKTIRLNEINEKRYFAGDYTLKTTTSKLTIITQLIDQQDLLKLKSVLEKLPVDQN